MKLASLAPASVLLLAACAAPSVGVSNAVLAAEQSLTLAEQTALIYTRLPRCDTSGATICSDQATVDRIKALDNKAYAAVVAARSNETLLSDAIAATNAFSLAVPKKGS